VAPDPPPAVLSLNETSDEVNALNHWDCMTPLHSAKSAQATLTHMFYSLYPDPGPTQAVALLMTARAFILAAATHPQAPISYLVTE
jgi:hypothetical protein